MYSKIFQFFISLFLFLLLFLLISLIAVNLTNHYSQVSDQDRKTFILRETNKTSTAKPVNLQFEGK